MGHKSPSSQRFWVGRLYRLAKCDAEERREAGEIPCSGAPTGYTIGPICPVQHIRCGRVRYSAGNKNLAYYRGNTENIPLNRTKRATNIGTYVDGTRLVSPVIVRSDHDHLSPIPYPRFDWQAE